MFVYRVEREDGLGPWCNAQGDFSSGAGTAWCNNAVGIHSAADSHLRQTKYQINWRFGFLSLDQMFQYMYPMNPLTVSDTIKENVLKLLGKMLEARLLISVYKTHSSRSISDTLGDTTQCIFDLSQAELIGRLSPLHSLIRDALDEYGKKEQRILRAVGDEPYEAVEEQFRSDSMRHVGKDGPSLGDMLNSYRSEGYADLQRVRRTVPIFE